MHPKAPTGTRTFVIRNNWFGKIRYMLPWNAEGLRYTADMDAARKFSTFGDAALFRDENRGAYPVESIRDHHEVWPVPAECLDPVTGQYAGANGGGA